MAKFPAKWGVHVTGRIFLHALEWLLKVQGYYNR